MNLATVKSITIPEGIVKALSIGGVKVWEKAAAVSETLGKVWVQSNITDCGDVEWIEHANGVWVAAVYKEGLYYSENGKTWTQSNITAGAFWCVAYGNGLWLAANWDKSMSALYKSTDGKNWTVCSFPAADCSRVAYANGIWIAGAYRSNQLYYSEDGETWTLALGDASSTISAQHRCLEYVNGRWFVGNVIFNIESVNVSRSYTSIDGKTWTKCADVPFYAVAYNNGVWVATRGNDGYCYSTDGETWKYLTTFGGPQAALAVIDGLFVAGCYAKGGNGEYGIYYSEDGLTWVKTNVTAVAFRGMDVASGVAVAGGKSTGGGLYYSEDGKTWTLSNLTLSNHLSFKYVNGLWVTGGYGNGGLYYSE